MEKVILLHGIFLPSAHLSCLVKDLKKTGFSTLNISYPSTKYRLADLTEIVWKQIADEFRQDHKLHFVCFSMGNLIIRRILQKHQPKNAGRLVMIAPPNQGSELADYFAEKPWARFLYGPALRDLTTKSCFDLPQIDPQKVEYGIIAGNKPTLPLFNLFFKAPNDGKVSVKSTVLEGAKEHLVLPFSHSRAPFDLQVRKACLSFVRTGSFAS